MPTNGSDKPETVLKALMFTDLVDSSKLKEDLGDAVYFGKFLQPHNRLFREVLAQFPAAREIKFTGDGFICTFNSVVDAVNLALAFQYALHVHAWSDVVPSTRVGIHLGDTIEYLEHDGKSI